MEWVALVIYWIVTTAFGVYNIKKYDGEVTVMFLLLSVISSWAIVPLSLITIVSLRVFNHPIWKKKVF